LPAGSIGVPSSGFGTQTVQFVPASDFVASIAAPTPEGLPVFGSRYSLRVRVLVLTAVERGVRGTGRRRAGRGFGFALGPLR